MIDDTPPDISVEVEIADLELNPERSGPGVDGWTHSPGMELINCPLCLYPSSDHRLIACWPAQPLLLNPFNPEVQNYDKLAICDVGGWHFHRRCERCGYSWVTAVDEPQGHDEN